MYDNFDYQGFLAKNKLGPYAKTGKLNEAGFNPDQMQLDHDLEQVYTMVEEALGNDVSEATFNTIVKNIQDQYQNSGERNVYDFTREYLMDWVSDARSEGGGRLTKDDNNSIWGSDWQGVISRATETPEPDDDYYSQDKGSYDKNAGWQGRTNPLEEELEENAQEDEDGEQVTHRSTEPKAIEILEPLSNGYVISVEMPDGRLLDVDFEWDGEREEVDPPYGYAGTIWGEIDGKEYGIAVDLVNAGGGDYDIDISSDGLNFVNEGGTEDFGNISEDENAPEATEEHYRKLIDAFHGFMDLKKAGIITQEELDSISRGIVPAYDRLRAAKGE